MHAFAASPTKLMYHESVIFSISRVGALRGQSSGWARTHGEERGEKFRRYRQERRAQCGEGYEASGAHYDLHVHTVIECRAIETSAVFCSRHTIDGQTKCD